VHRDFLINLYISLGVKGGRSVRLAVANVLNNFKVRMQGALPALIDKCLWFGVLSLLLSIEK
jgi:hypothetical protein